MAVREGPQDRLHAECAREAQRRRRFGLPPSVVKRQPGGRFLSASAMRGLSGSLAPNPCVPRTLDPAAREPKKDWIQLFGAVGRKSEDQEAGQADAHDADAECHLQL